MKFKPFYEKRVFHERLTIACLSFYFTGMRELGIEEQKHVSVREVKIVEQLNADIIENSLKDSQVLYLFKDPSERGGCVRLSDNRTIIARLAVLSGEIGWVLFESEKEDDVYHCRGALAFVRFKRSLLEILFEPNSRVARWIQRQRMSFDKLADMLLRNDKDGVVWRQFTDTEVELIAENVSFTIRAIDRRKALRIISVTCGSLLLIKPPIKESFKRLSTGFQTPIQHEPEQGVPQEPESEAGELSDVSRWEYFNRLDFMKAREYLERFGPEIAFQVGDQARLLLVRISDGVVICEFGNPGGIVSTGFRVFEPGVGAVTETVYSNLLRYCGHAEGTNRSLFVEFDTSSLLAYAGDSHIHQDQYRIILKVGDYDENGRRIGGDTDEVIRRINGVTGASGSVRLMTLSTLDFLTNPALATREFGCQVGAVQQGGMVSIRRAIGADAENIQEVYVDAVANRFGFIYSQDWERIQGGLASNVCMFTRVVMKALAQLCFRLFEMGRTSEQMPIVIERSVHPPMRDGDGNVIVYSTFPMDVLRHGDGGYYVDVVNSPDNLYQLMLEDPTVMVQPYSGFPGGFVRRDSSFRGEDSIFDIGGLTSDAMVGEHHDFVIFFPPGKFSALSILRVVPGNSRVTWGSQVAGGFVALLTQVIIREGEQDEALNRRIMQQNNEAVLAILQRHRLLTGEDQSVYEARESLRRAVDDHEFNTEVLASSIRTIIKHRNYAIVVNRLINDTINFIKTAMASSNTQFSPEDVDEQVDLYNEFGQRLLNLANLNDFTVIASRLEELWRQYGERMFDRYSLFERLRRDNLPPAYRDLSQLADLGAMTFLCLLFDIGVLIYSNEFIEFFPEEYQIIYRELFNRYASIIAFLDSLSI